VTGRLAAVPGLHRALIIAALPLAFAACGGGGGDGGGGDGGSSDRSSQSPQQVLQSMTSELAKVRSYHVEGTETDDDGRSAITGDVTADGALSIRLAIGAKKMAVIVADRQAYIRANAAFWNDQAGGSGGRLARLLADRWVKSPDDDLGSLEQLTPKNLAYCASRASSTVVDGGTRDHDGQKVVVLRDKGAPGDAPGDVYVPATGRALPVRVLQTGPRPSGGTLDPRCDSEDSTTKTSDIRMSRFDQPVEIKAPADALDLSRLQGSSATQSS
jgi:hypothetical protein